jgi:hypothetical protein
LGSFFAGVKAGTLGGVVYVGGMAAFNVALLYGDKQAVLNLINQQYYSVCTTGSTIQQCFDSVVSVDVPYVAFVAFFIALIYSGAFGMFYDSLPGRASLWKGEIFAAIIGANLTFFGFSGFYFSAESTVATSVFVFGWSIVFGYLLGRLYRKYTRVVQISSENPALLKVFIDRRDVTGKTRTFAATSSHKIRGEVAEDASFKEWAANGGVTLEDPRSFDTTFEVTGDGTLTGKVGTKY